ncbi:E3 ubiquitin-protein ligase TRIM39-like [Ambystoma mexicanum]|uniref:E3 ubiquitin-protein ligase TRIM39-like n=1 Tax=Ambystoma mexicanum TaxID=8296 RepID=UPI0037E91EDD
MATAALLQSLTEEATCSICLEYFKGPVSVECGHAYCLTCITQCWEGLEANFPCPQCRVTSQSKTLRPYRQLGNVAELAKRLHVSSATPQAENMCREHDEKLKLFCEDDQKPICLVCRESKDHKNHTVRPVSEAAHKDKFKKCLRTMKRALEVVVGLRNKKEDVTELKDNFKRRRTRIEQEFKDVKSALSRCENLGFQSSDSDEDGDEDEGEDADEGEYADEEEADEDADGEEDADGDEYADGGEYADEGEDADVSDEDSDEGEDSDGSVHADEGEYADEDADDGEDADEGEYVDEGEYADEDADRDEDVVGEDADDGEDADEGEYADEGADEGEDEGEYADEEEEEEEDAAEDDEDAEDDEEEVEM